MTPNNSDSTTETAGSSTEGPAVRLCSKCHTNPRQARGSWCTECRREAQRAYNTRTRPRPQEKTADCAVCGSTMTWISGQGPDRVYCSASCKRRADTAVQTERRRTQLGPEAQAQRAERKALLEQSMRKCNMCSDIKPLEDFHRRGTGYQHRCKECVTAHGTIYVAEQRMKSWRFHLKVRFGLTPVQWDQLLLEQAGRCYLCGDPMTEPHVDHDHDCCPSYRTCGECIRGLACNSCNTAIGHLNDDPDRIRLVASNLQARKTARRTVSA